MSDRASPHLRLVADVRRRWAMTRALECAAVCATVAAVGAPIAVLLARRTSLPLSSVLDLMAVGTVLAALARLARQWPTATAAAMVVDRQFGWDDLVLTARATAGSGDPFAAAVRAAADHRCRDVRPSDVSVARLGRRAWAGLAIVTVASVAATLLIPDRSRLTDADRADLASAAVLAADPPPVPASPTVPDVPAPRRTGVDPIDERGTPPADVVQPPTDSPSDHAMTLPAAAVSPGSAGRGRATAASPREPTMVSPRARQRPAPTARPACPSRPTRRPPSRPGDRPTGPAPAAPPPFPPAACPRTTATSSAGTSIRRRPPAERRRGRTRPPENRCIYIIRFFRGKVCGPSATPVTCARTMAVVVHVVVHAKGWSV
jgi:hypothetical protein